MIRCSGIALVIGLAAWCAVVPAAAHAAGDPSAAELWQDYPLDPDASHARRGGVAPSRAGRDVAIGTSDRAVDGRLMLQLGMLGAALYAVFLCVWFSATRTRLGLGDAVEDRRLRRLRGPQADPQAVWTCAIGWRGGRVRSRFRAIVAPPDGRRQWVVAQSKRLRWPPRKGETSATAELVSALESLVTALVAAGWEPVETAGSWSARRFVWRREGDPPARL